MIRLQLLTAMRPGEVCIMRGIDIDMTRKEWVYRPSRHKNQSRGHNREILLGAKAREIIRPFLTTDLDAYLFSPADAEAHRRKLLGERRTTPLNEGNRPGSNRRQQPKRRPGMVYSASIYYRAIIRGCDAAYPAPEELLDVEKSAELIRWRKDHRWHPHQLRHTRATEIRKKYGLEGAQAILGHRSVQAAQIYAERNSELATAIVTREG
jgi:integrase